MNDKEGPFQVKGTLYHCRIVYTHAEGTATCPERLTANLAHSLVNWMNTVWKMKRGIVKERIENESS